MSLFAPTFSNLRELFLNELRDLYSAEKQLVDALPKMAEAATLDSLKTAFKAHLTETQGHVVRLERVFDLLNVDATEHTCQAMKGLISEGSDYVKAGGDDSVRDAGLIGAAQKVEHYEIAGYGTLRNLARALGESEAAEILQQTLDEEGATDKKLTAIAEGWVNAGAAHAPNPDQRGPTLPAADEKRKATMPSARENPGGMVEKAPFGNT